MYHLVMAHLLFLSIKDNFLPINKLYLLKIKKVIEVIIK